MTFKSNNNGGLKKLAKNARELGGKRQVKLTDLMTPEFVSNCSNFRDLEHLFDESGFVVESQEDFKAIPDTVWEEFIVKNTSFDSWEAMQKAAGAEYMKKNLFKGL
jgi:hypothetical protein